MMDASLAGPSDDGHEDKRRELNTMLMPEYAVPYAVHLIAHHPDFPEDKSEATRIKQCEKYLKGLLEALVESLGQEADNVSFLHQMFEKIKNHCDALDDDEFRFQLLSTLAQKALKKMIKNPDNIKPYPGTIFLPAQLFKERSAESMAQDRDEDEDAEDGGGKEFKQMKSPSGFNDWGSPIAPASGTSSAGGSKRKGGGTKRKASSRRNDLDDDVVSEDGSVASSDAARGEDMLEDEEIPDIEEEILDARCDQPVGSPNGKRRNNARKAKGNMYYLVKWSGRSVEDATWVLAKDIVDKTLIVDFEKRSARMDEAEEEVAAAAANEDDSMEEEVKDTGMDEDDEQEEEEEEVAAAPRAKNSKRILSQSVSGSNRRNSSRKREQAMVYEDDEEDSAKSSSQQSSSQEEEARRPRLRNSSNASNRSSSAAAADKKATKKKKQTASSSPNAKEQVEEDTSAAAQKRNKKGKAKAAPDTESEEEDSPPITFRGMNKRRSVRNVR